MKGYKLNQNRRLQVVYTLIIPIFVSLITTTY